MFMPNKIKKGKDLKLNHDLVDKSKSDSNFKSDMNQLIMNIMP
jgi:hypothetical protein